MVGGEWRLCHNKKLNKINFHPKNGVVLVILDSQLSRVFLKASLIYCKCNIRLPVKYINCKQYHV